MCCWRHLRSPHRLSIQRPQMGNLQRPTCLEIAYAPPSCSYLQTLKTWFACAPHWKQTSQQRSIRLCWNHKSNQDSASVNKAASHPCRQRQWPLDEPLALSITPLWHPLSAVTDEKSRNDMNYNEWKKRLLSLILQMQIWCVHISNLFLFRCVNESHQTKLNLESIVPKQQHQNLPEQPLAKYVL